MKVETKPVYVTTTGKMFTDKHSAVEHELLNFCEAMKLTLTDHVCSFIDRLTGEQGLSLMKQIVNCDIDHPDIISQ